MIQSIIECVKMRKIRNQKKFSVIVPVYNVERYLRRCIDSILGQRFTDFEVILVDDGSTDASGKICEEYSNDKRAIVIHEKNGGLSEARNSGIRAARGEYLLFVDSDDFWADNGFLERIVVCLKEKPDFLLFSLKRCNETETKFWTIYPALDEKLLNRLEYGKAQNYFMKQDVYLVSACCKAIRTEFLKEKELYFEKGLLSEDIDWHIRLVLAAKRMVYSNENGYVYRVREHSITTAPNAKNRKDLYKIIAKWADYFREEPQSELNRAMLALLSYEYFILLGYCDRHRTPGKEELERYSWLIRYGNSRKIRLCRWAYWLLGKKRAGNLYGYVVRKRQGN